MLTTFGITKPRVCGQDRSHEQMQSTERCAQKPDGGCICRFPRSLQTRPRPNTADLPHLPPPRCGNRRCYGFDGRTLGMAIFAIFRSHASVAIIILISTNKRCLLRKGHQRGVLPSHTLTKPHIPCPEPGGTFFWILLINLKEETVTMVLWYSWASQHCTAARSRL
jgi:hypothetical protein